LGRPFHIHIDKHELNALVPCSSETGYELLGLTPDELREAERHVHLCVDCSVKVSKYRQLVNRSLHVISAAAPPGTDCPKKDDVDWHEVATGQWPELKAKQLMMHAALCDHCGPLLRAAVSVDDHPTPQKEKPPTERKVPSQPGRIRWLIPAIAFLIIIGLLTKIPSTSPTSPSASKFAEFAVNTHRQHTQGRLALDVLSDSQQTLNEWFKAKLQYHLALPASPTVPGEERPYRLEGARLMPVGGATAAYIAYKMRPGAASLIVTPDTVAVASGGVEANFKKVSFHYTMVDGYKVVTWSAHGLTYALVSDEGNNTQRSCMVCHSAMRDRDLSHTPTPLQAHGNTFGPILQ
jgi:anti-sigma factor RsiW